MITKELENKLKTSENTCIHCSTLELAKQVLGILHKLGLKWYSGEYYTLDHNWNSFKENSIYHPFDGKVSHIEYAQQNNYKIISAEKFIALHTEDFDLENYIPKGELIGFPKEIIAKMLDYQEEQGNKRDVTIFENNIRASICYNGFYWDETKEGDSFWNEVIRKKDFDLFFEKYPKKEDSQVFRVGDKVYDIMLGEIGIVTKVILNDVSPFPIEVYYEECGRVLYALEGRFLSIDKYPRLLHYRDDYDYSVIDFNNLPQRQELKRWRAEVGEKYYYLDIYFEVHSFLEEYSNTDTKLYKIGNYFQTKEEAQELADMFKKCYQELIKEEPKRWRAEEGGCYHFVSFDERCWFYSNGAKDDYASFDNNNYNSGNYFRTEVEAEIIAQKLNSYFKQLIKEEHDTYRN